MGGQRWILGLVVLSVTCGSPGLEALACEAGVCLHPIWPEDGAVDVPTNARIWIHYDVAGTFGVDAILRDDSGAEVAVTSEVIDGGKLELVSPLLLLLTPEAPLVAGGEYTLELMPEMNVCAEPELMTFSVGNGEDGTPPEFGGIQSVDAWFIEGAGATGPCDVGPDRHHYEVIGAETSGVAAYRLYEQGELVGVSWTPTLVSQVTGSGDAPDRCFVMRAVDLAGNEDPNDDLHCLVPAEGDDDDSAGDDDSGGGDCTCRHEFRTLGAGWVLAALAGLYLGWRRRKRLGDFAE